MSIYRGPSSIGTSTDTVHSLARAAAASALDAANSAITAVAAQLASEVSSTASEASKVSSGLSATAAGASEVAAAATVASANTLKVDVQAIADNASASAASALAIFGTTAAMEAANATTAANAAASAADRTQTGLDRTAAADSASAASASQGAATTSAANAQTAAAAAVVSQTASSASEVAANTSKLAAAASASSANTSEVNAATSLANVGSLESGTQTHANAAYNSAVATAADRVATAADRASVALDRVTTTNDRLQTGVDRAALSASVSASAGSAAQALAIYGTTNAMNTALQTAAAQNSLAQTAAASASSVLQQDLSAISAALHRSPNAVTAMCIMDLSKDSDGGAWADKCQHTSWYNEPLNGAWLGAQTSEAACRAISGAATGDYFQLTTDGKFYKLNATAGVTEVFRGNKAKPGRLMAAIAEGTNVNIYDLTEKGCPMWMRFAAPAVDTAKNIINNNIGGVITSVASGNGLLLVGATANSGLSIVSFLKDSGVLAYPSTGYQYQGNISQRNSVKGHVAEYSAPRIVNSIVNAVALTVLPDAPVDPVTGLQVPTIAVATAGGVSVIKHDGAVVSKGYNAGTTRTVSIYGATVFVGAISPDSYNGVWTWDYLKDVVSNYGGRSGTPRVVNDFASSAGSFYAPRLTVTHAASRLVSLFRENKTTPAKGLLASITPAFSTGYMVGDICRAYLCNTEVESVSGAELVTNGTFDVDTAGWFGSQTKPATAAAVSGEMQVTPTGDYGRELILVNCVIGKTYAVKGTARIVSGTAAAYLGVSTDVTSGSGAIAAASTSSTTPVPLSFTFVATATTMAVVAGENVVGTGGVLGFDNISVKEAIPDRSYKAAAAAVYGSLVKSPVA